jgi:hypothetical protein
MALTPKQPASSPHSWWQRACRGLWRVMTVLWGGILLSVFVSIVTSILTASTDTPLTKLYVIHWIITYFLPLLLIAGVLLLLTIVSWVGSREHAGSSSLSPDRQSRLTILKSLRKAYTDELAASLQGLARIPLWLHEHFDLTHPARLVTWQPKQSERALPTGTTIVDAYDQAGNGLLILGEPGVGKSTLLYDLAQAFLSRAEQNEQDRLPVILSLSSWATKRLPLETWLVGELQRRYSIPRPLGRRWEQQGKLLLLLDGLDEVAATARDACVKAINTYHSERLGPLVVCSRRGEYEALPEQLTLQSAVIVQPLSSEQVKDYLATTGEALAAVRMVMKANPVLQELLTTPLMLSVVVLAYRGKAVKDLPQLGTAEQQQQQIFADYVERVLDQRTKKGDYTPQQPRQWLTWLAQRMQQFSLSEFYLEWLQPRWLATKQAQTHYTWLLVGLLVGMGLIFGLLSGLIYGLLVGLLFGLLFGLIGRSDTREIRFVEVWSWKGFRRGLFVGLLFGLGLALFVVYLSGLIYGLIFGLLFGLGLALFVGLGFGLLFGIVESGSGIQIIKDLRRRPNQGISSSGRNALFFGMFFGLPGLLLPGLGLGLGLVFGLLFGGRAYLQHYLLRFLLWRSGTIPWHYVRFLEWATERILLQRVGGGYRFIHPLFQEYFASGAARDPPVVEPLFTQQP